jgi:ABC-type Na+ transport system ATPase subunit NatA
LARPDGGTAPVLGFDVVSEKNAIRTQVAVTGQFASLDDDLTGYGNLIVFGRLSRAASKQRVDEAVRDDLTVDEVMALVAGAFAAIRHVGAETSRERSAHVAQLILDGLRPQPR